jgi:hypothetical protein
MTSLGNMKDWTGSADEVYIGRAGHGFDGYFGNPCRKEYKCIVCNNIHTTTKQVLKCFEVYARARVKNDKEYRIRVKALLNKKLMCFCYPKPCHGLILIQLSKELNSNSLLF